jgi:intracellular septation protein A
MTGDSDDVRNSERVTRALDTYPSHPHHIIALPSVRNIFGQAGRYGVLGMLIPTGLFYAVFAGVGLRGALLAALAWSYGLIAQRLLRRRRVEATLLLGAGLMSFRAVVTWFTGSSFLYFLQPTLGTFATAAALIGSAFLGRPLLEKVAKDFVQLPAALTERPQIGDFFSRISLIWGVTYLLNGCWSLHALTSSSVGSFLLLSKSASLFLTFATIGISIWLFRRTVRGERIVLHWGPPKVALAA